jgi:hypothetical protein
MNIKIEVKFFNNYFLMTKIYFFVGYYRMLFIYRLKDIRNGKKKNYTHFKSNSPLCYKWVTYLYDHAAYIVLYIGEV